MMAQVNSSVREEISCQIIAIQPSILGDIVTSETPVGSCQIISVSR